ncbi:MAG TPA: hypothetical protein VNA28_13915 [Solirubrobacteraceae bacterium]|nr:hypothetical protein [Solirubrobacteraceae bacterium]
MRPTDSRGMAAMYMSLTDDEPIERRRPTLAVLAFCIFMALATPVGWALAADGALAATTPKAVTTSDDDNAVRGGAGGDDDDADDSVKTVSGTDNSVSSPNTGSHSLTLESRSTPGNSVSNPNTSHSVTKPSVSLPGNSASNPNTSHSVTRR